MFITTHQSELLALAFHLCVGVVPHHAHIQEMGLCKGSVWRKITENSMALIFGGIEHSSWHQQELWVFCTFKKQAPKASFDI